MNDGEKTQKQLWLEYRHLWNLLVENNVTNDNIINHIRTIDKNNNKNKLWEKYNYAWQLVVKNNLIKGNIVNEATDLIQEAKLDNQNFGKAGIFTIESTQSEKLIIGQNADNIFASFRQEVNAIFDPSYRHVLERDVEDYPEYLFNVDIYTNRLFTDSKYRSEKFNEIIKNSCYSGYDVYLSDY